MVVSYYSIGELVEALCTLNYSSIGAPRNEFENAKQLCKKFQATDKELAETNEEYKELKEMHDELLIEYLGEKKEFIQEVSFK